MTTASSTIDNGYLRFFQLDLHPFPVAPDDRNFYISDPINEIVTEIVHGIRSRKGFIVLTGDIGLGKTTISRRIIKLLAKEETETALVLHTTLQQGELLKEINRDFNLLAAETGEETIGDQLHRLNQYLLERNREGKNCAIIIDDAQNLDHQSLELIRTISNLEADQQKLVQILLVGQPELVAKLNDPELRQLKSRVIIQKEAKPLNMQELAHYIMFKLNLAGDKGMIRLHPKAVKQIRKYSEGNFRRVNILMDRALYVAFVHNTREITSRIIEAAKADLYEKQPAFSMKRLAFGMVPVLGGIVLAIALLFGLNRYFSTDASATLRSPVSTHAIAAANRAQGSNLISRQAPSGMHQRIRTDEKAPDQLHPPISAKATAEPEVLEFLKSYGLERYEQMFAAALRDHRFDQVRDKIFKEEGYRLMVLEDIPESIQGHYGVLIAADVRGEEKQLLFWKPRLQVGSFYYGYMGKEVMELQIMLSRRGLYRGEIDGIVGKQLLKALVDFQRQSRIKVTGLPDPATLFLLSEGKESNGDDRS